MTPRRILLLMGGLFACGVVYALYARALGWLDGLPLLPEQMLRATDGKFRPPERATSPTIERLKLSFGANAPETETSFYPTQLEFRNGDTSIVLASGSPPSNPNSNTVTLTPFSIAIFSKPRPAHLMQPGEVNEITTFHSDKAVLEFDRVIQTPADMNSAKLIRMQLISDPEASVPASDKRAGIVHITNNQRSADPNRSLVLKTVGPVFYRDPKYASGPDQLGPDVWTDSAIEIADRSNLPRKPNTDAAVAPALAEEVRNAEAVVAMLKGDRLPPPTVTAVGMRIYLDSDDPQKNPAPKAAQAKKGTAGFSGVRRVELLEKVLLNLWVEGGQGTLVGSGTKPGPGVEPQSGFVAVAGALVPAAHAARELSRDLLQVETRGPFAYDADKNLARFDVLPQANPNLRNDVRVTKVPPRPGVQSLFSQVLEIEFNGAPTGNQPGRTPPGATPEPGGGPRFKRLHAWTYTPGRYLTVSSDADQMDAHGQDLVHEQALQKTTLTGSPLHAVQQRNILTAGSPKKPAVLIIEPAPAGARPAGGARTSNQATVLGAGRVELYDAAAKANTTSATWQTSMVHTKERIDGSELDLFTLTDGARFEDVHADYWLMGKVLKLWLLPAANDPAAGPGTATASRARPHRIQAIGDVSGHSAELDIEKSDQLIAYFADVAPVAAASGPVEPKSPAAPAAAPPGPMPAPKPVAENEPAKPAKPPMKVRARTIDTWVTRSTAPVPAGAPAVPAAPGTVPAGAGIKYQLEKARCEGMVSVHQDPQDATKPRGTDILGSRMLIDSTPDGSILTVFGWDERPGEVHNEGTSLIGPKIVIDQLHNLAVIEGRGSIAIPSSGDLTGAETKTSEPVVIHFRDGMTFMGARQTAEFFGKVSASQAGSQIACHTMRVLFDRPVYFTQSNRPRAPATGGTQAKEEKAKIDVVYCYPAPGDTADSSLEKIVTYTQVDREPQSGKPFRLQRIEAQEITLRAQFRDSDRSEPYRLVTAHGPGTVRTWAPGSRDDDPAGPVALGGPPPAKQPNGKPGEIEMKLTVVRFAVRMTAKDKGNIYKEATFTDQIKVVHVPTENPELDVNTQLPSRAVLLTCNEKLVVWTRKVDNGPPQQSMHAHGNAYLQNDEYEGWGEVIQSEGKMVRFFGTKDLLARIKSRFGGTDQAGETITYDRATNHSKVDGSIGGTMSTRPSGGPPPKKQNRPIPPR